MESKTAENLLMAARVAVTAAFVLWVLFIWHNSVETAEVSAGRSGRVTEIVNGMLNAVGQESVTEHFVRKLAHFTEYGVEGVLTVLLFVLYYLKPVKRLGLSILTGLMTATVDESIQFFSAGRAPGILDVCIDMAGYICGMLGMSAVCLLIGKAPWKRWAQKRNGRKKSVR